MASIEDIKKMIGNPNLEVTPGTAKQLPKILHVMADSIDSQTDPDEVKALAKEVCVPQTNIDTAVASKPNNKTVPSTKAVYTALQALPSWYPLKSADITEEVPDSFSSSDFANANVLVYKDGSTINAVVFGLLDSGVAVILDSEGISFGDIATN